MVEACDRPQLGKDEYQLHRSFASNTGQITNEKEDKTVLIPFMKAIAPVVDLESGRIEITPPPGLLEIND